MGYDCYRDKEGGSLRDRITGEVIPLERRGSLYTFKMLVRQDPGEIVGRMLPGRRSKGEQPVRAIRKTTSIN